MSNLFCRNPNASEFRGAAYEIAAVKCFLHLICQNFRKFAVLCPGLPQFAIICYPAETCQAIYLVQLCKKYLTFADALLYNRRRAFANLSRALPKYFLTLPRYARIIPGWARGLTKTCAQNYFYQRCKKYLTNSLRHCTIGAPAPKTC